MKFGFVAKHRGIWPVRWLCEALDVSRSGFHAWLSRSPSARARGDEVVGAQVRGSMRKCGVDTSATVQRLIPSHPPATGTLHFLMLPNEGAIIRLIGAVLLEANDEWQLQHRYMQTEAMAELTPPIIDAVPTQIATAAA